MDPDAVWVVSGVGQGMGVLDGVHMPQGKGEVLGIFCSHWLEWYIFKQKCVRLMREKLTMFPYRQYIIGNVCSLAFQRNAQVQDQSWGLQEICKI